MLTHVDSLPKVFVDLVKGSMFTKVLQQRRILFDPSISMKR